MPPALHIRIMGWVQSIRRVGDGAPRPHRLPSTRAPRSPTTRPYLLTNPLGSTTVTSDAAGNKLSELRYRDLG